MPGNKGHMAPVITRIRKLGNDSVRKTLSVAFYLFPFLSFVWIYIIFICITQLIIRCYLLHTVLSSLMSASTFFFASYCTS